MASGFPGSIDNFTDPLTTSALNSPSHAGQHQDLNDAVEKIETYMGLVKVIPTAPTGCTISSTGTVTIGNAVGTVSMTCFSALYDNYRIICAGGVASATINVLFNLNGITAAASHRQLGYYQGYGSSSTTAYAADSTTIIASHGTTGGYGFIIDITNPFATTIKQGSTVASSTTTMYSFPFMVNSTLSSSGFTLTGSGGTLTGGTIRVYGYRN